MLATTRQYAARVVSLLARIDSWEASYDKCEPIIYHRKSMWFPAVTKSSAIFLKSF